MIIIKTLEEAITPKSLVEFWKENCQKCEAMEAILDKFQQTALDVGIYKIDASQEQVEKYGLRNSPTFFVITNGQITNKAEGMMTQEKLVEFMAGTMPAGEEIDAMKAEVFTLGRQIDAQRKIHNEKVKQFEATPDNKLGADIYDLEEELNTLQSKQKELNNKIKLFK